MRTLAVYNLKGGVGKTATAVNLGWLAAGAGHRVLLWDLDPQGAATWYLRVKARVKGGGKRLVAGKLDLAKLVKGSDYEGLDLLPADFSYRKMDLALAEMKKPRRRLGRLAKPVRKGYDLLLLDCPPGITLVAESVFRAADALLVPTIPTPLSMRTLARLRSHLGKKGPKRLVVLPFFSMVDRRKTIHRETVDEPRKRRPFPFLETAIPYASAVERMGVHRAPLGTFAKRSRAASAYAALWREVAEVLFPAGRKG